MKVKEENEKVGLKLNMTQKDGMGREVGGGLGWGTHVNPWLISCQCMAKTTTIL